MVVASTRGLGWIYLDSHDVTIPREDQDVAVNDLAAFPFVVFEVCLLLVDLFRQGLRRRDERGLGSCNRGREKKSACALTWFMYSVVYGRS